MFSFVARYVFLLRFCFPYLGLRAVWMCLEPLLSFFRLSYLCPIMRASSGSSCSVGLHIEGRLVEGAEFEQVGGGSGGLPNAAIRAPLVGHPPLPGKGKERISEIRYPTGSEYLRAAVRCSDAVGPSQVEPSFAEIFATPYRPPIGIHAWRPNFLTSYVVHVLKMVCFFEATFENGIRFPFFLQVCPSALQHMPSPAFPQLLERFSWPPCCFQG